jgi:hypothetical protein
MHVTADFSKAFELSEWREAAQQKAGRSKMKRNGWGIYLLRLSRNVGLYVFSTKPLADLVKGRFVKASDNI